MNNTAPKKQLERSSGRNTLVSAFDKRQVKEMLDMMYLAYLSSDYYDQHSDARTDSYFILSTIQNAIDELFDHHIDTRVIE